MTTFNDLPRMEQIQKKGTVSNKGEQKVIPFTTETAAKKKRDGIESAKAIIDFIESSL